MRKEEETIRLKAKIQAEKEAEVAAIKAHKEATVASIIAQKEANVSLLRVEMVLFSLSLLSVSLSLSVLILFFSYKKVYIGKGGRAKEAED